MRTKIEKRKLKYSIYTIIYVEWSLIKHHSAYTLTVSQQKTNVGTLCYSTFRRRKPPSCMGYEVSPLRYHTYSLCKQEEEYLNEQRKGRHELLLGKGYWQAEASSTQRKRYFYSSNSSSDEEIIFSVRLWSDCSFLALPMFSKKIVIKKLWKNPAEKCNF